MLTKSREKVLLSNRESTISFCFVTTSMIGHKVSYCYLLRLGYLLDVFNMIDKIYI